MFHEIPGSKNREKHVRCLSLLLLAYFRHENPLRNHRIHKTQYKHRMITQNAQVTGTCPLFRVTQKSKKTSFMRSANIPKHHHTIEHRVALLAPVFTINALQKLCISLKSTTRQ
jgi:hypothetical protein